MPEQIEVMHARKAKPAQKLSRLLWPHGMRWCGGCQNLVAICYCPKNSARCRACVSEANHGARIGREYGMTPDEYQALLAFQDGLCAICDMRPKKIKLHVDHSHKTGQVRGLLCENCNHKLLGAAYHDPEILRRAADYLENPPWMKMYQA